jgi:hypothetical protein
MQNTRVVEELTHVQSMVNACWPVVRDVGLHTVTDHNSTRTDDSDLTTLSREVARVDRSAVLPMLAFRRLKLLQDAEDSYTRS